MHDVHFDFSILHTYICVILTTVQTSSFNFRLVLYINHQSKHIHSTALTKTLRNCEYYMYDLFHHRVM